MRGGTASRGLASGTIVAGRYKLGPRLASGGMATVYLGQALGAVGFARTVAIKRLHEQYASEPDFVSMLIDEARLASKIHHPNVVPTLDVVSEDDELFVIMEYVEGDSLSRLLALAKKKGITTPVAVSVRIVIELLSGLDAAHDMVDDAGALLGVVHRDVSTQNVLVGTDGITRVIDFGIAKASGRVQVTVEGQIKGKLAFMAPEQLLGKPVDRRVDIYGASVILWELLTGDRLFRGQSEGHLVAAVLKGVTAPPSSVVPGLSKALDAAVMRGLSVDAKRRFETARAMAAAVEDACPPARTREIADWVRAVAGEQLEERRLALKGAVAPPGQASAPSVSARSADGGPQKDAAQKDAGQRPAGRRESRRERKGVELDPAPDPDASAPGSDPSGAERRMTKENVLKMLSTVNEDSLGKATATMAVTPGAATSGAAPAARDWRTIAIVGGIVLVVLLVALRSGC